MPDLTAPIPEMGKRAFDRLSPEARCQVEALIEDQVKGMPDFLKKVQANAYALANDEPTIEKRYLDGRAKGGIKGICS